MTALTDADLSERLDFACRIAAACGRRLMALRAGGRWPDGAQLGDVGDQVADAYLQGAIGAKYPDDGILSEETREDTRRLGKRLAWIVDPLDGTREYSAGRNDWAVHVGFTVDGVATLGAVALPAVDRVMGGIVNGRTVLHGEAGEWPLTFAVDDGPPRDRSLRLIVSRSHTPEWVHRLAQGIGRDGHSAELVPCGSVGFKVAMLLWGKGDLYVHKRGLHEWDTCAPEAVARACGYAVQRFDGSEQRYNRADPRCDEIVVCRPWLRERALQVLAGIVGRA